MTDVKVPLALVAAMVAQVIAGTWYFAEQAHKIDVLVDQIAILDEVVLTLEADNQALITFATFTENKWAEAYSEDMTYVRVFGTKPAKEN